MPRKLTEKPPTELRRSDGPRGRPPSGQHATVVALQQQAGNAAVARIRQRVLGHTVGGVERGGGALRCRIQFTANGTASPGAAALPAHPDVVVHTSWQKHCQGSYFLREEITAEDSGRNANTIALVSLEDFSAGFGEYAAEVGRRIATHGVAYDPSSPANYFNTTKGFAFGGDKRASGTEVHAYPVGGNVAVLNDREFRLLKLVASVMQGWARVPHLAGISLLQRLDTPEDDAAWPAVATMLALTRGQLETRVAELRAAETARNQEIADRARAQARAGRAANPPPSPSSSNEDESFDLNLFGT